MHVSRLPLLCCLAAALATLSGSSLTQAVAQSPASPANSEQRAQRAFTAAKDNPPALQAFLEKMPKGADLHMHLSGAIYAETFLQDAREDQLCVSPRTLSFVRSTGTPQAPMGCPPGTRPVSDAFVGNDASQKLYDTLVDAFSMRSFVPSSGTSGHDQFFSTFSRFSGTSKQHEGEWLDEVASRAAAQNEQYLEVMQTPDFSTAISLGGRFGWPTTPVLGPNGQDVAGTSTAELSALRDKLLAAGLRDEIAVDRKQVDDALAGRERIEHCGQAGATPPCAVKIRYIYQILRQNLPQQVFAQTLLGFEVASADPNVVGINFVQPEDAYLSMSEYSRQMRMLDYLHSVYPKVHISLHAGELAPGMVPPSGLRFHIREAIDTGHAERIGHGVDVMLEDNPQALLKEMAGRHVMVEINLTSNDVILGIKAPWHPLPSYLAAHVPVALSTDDEGVSRIDLTHEYTLAALEFGLTYPQLKDMARTGIEHSFLPGESLWKQTDRFGAVVAACSTQPLGAADPRGDCGQFLKANEKAAQEWELEHRFKVFEAALP